MSWKKVVTEIEGSHSSYIEQNVGQQGNAYVVDINAATGVATARNFTYEEGGLETITSEGETAGNSYLLTSNIAGNNSYFKHMGVNNDDSGKLYVTGNVDSADDFLPTAYPYDGNVDWGTGGETATALTHTHSQYWDAPTASAASSVGLTFNQVDGDVIYFKVTSGDVFLTIGENAQPATITVTADGGHTTTTSDYSVYGSYIYWDQTDIDDGAGDLDGTEGNFVLTSTVYFAGASADGDLTGDLSIEGDIPHIGGFLTASIDLDDDGVVDETGSWGNEITTLTTTTADFTIDVTHDTASHEFLLNNNDGDSASVKVSLAASQEVYTNGAGYVRFKDPYHGSGAELYPKLAYPDRTDLPDATDEDSLPVGSIWSGNTFGLWMKTSR